MKKAMISLIAFLLLFILLTGCSSPKSDFTAALQKLALNKQYTADMNLTIPTATKQFQKNAL